MINERKKYFSNYFLIIIISSIALTNIEDAFSKPTELNIQQDYPIEAVRDDTLEVVTDTASAPSLTEDTIKPNIPLKNHGRISISGIEPYKIIEKYDIQTVLYSTITDLLEEGIASYPLSSGSFGQFNHISLFGGMPEDISFRFNGRRLNDAEYGTLNPELIPVEFMERAEIFVGTDAVTFSGNSSGGLINIQEIRYNTGKPYTRLWLSQAGGSFYASDGIFSQNFAKNWNGTFGFRRMSYPGRFENSQMDSWNVRGLLRWNISERMNISLSDIFTNHKIEINGGIDKSSQSYYDPIDAEVIYKEMAERIYRHDLTLSMSAFFDDDTSNSLSTSLYFTNNEFHRWRGNESFLNENDSIRYYNKTDIVAGVQGMLETAIFNNIKLKTGGEINYISSPETIYNQGWKGMCFAAFGWGSYELKDFFEIKAGARLSNETERTALSFGSALKFILSDSSTITGDLSVSQRIPTLTEGLSLRTEKHILGLLYYTKGNGNIKFNAGAFARMVFDPILKDIILNTDNKPVNLESYNAGEKIIFGLYCDYNQHLFDDGILLSIFDSDYISYNVKLQIYDSKIDDTVDKSFPNWHIKSMVEYHAKVGRSEASIGVSTKITGENYGFIFLPQKRGYATSDIREQTAFGGIDAYISLKLGNANIRLMMENILSNNYYYMPIYPQLDRNFRLALSWPFFD